MKLPETLPRACIFDLDGTLVDSLRDIAEALNDCLELLGVEPRPVDAYRYMVGEGIPMLCRRAIGESHAYLVERLAELARARYRTRPLGHTRPFSGVPELVERMRSAGVRLAVLSNKPHELTVRIVEEFWPNGEFDCVQGYVEEDLRKPNPHYVHEICGKIGCAPSETWFVGDTPTDVKTAHASGAVPIGVTWGFRSRADLADAGAEFIVDSPDEILPT